jgi:hypothetical protein
MGGWVDPRAVLDDMEKRGHLINVTYSEGTDFIEVSVGLLYIACVQLSALPVI